MDKDRYKPNVNQAYIPEDGGWTDHEGSPVLLLSIPAIEGLFNKENEGFSYAWLFDQSSNGYIFCFKLLDGTEHAILFKEGHAGALLTEEEMNGSFHIALVDIDLEKVDDETSVFWIPGIEFKRRP